MSEQRGLIEELRSLAEELPAQIRRSYPSGETKELPNDLMEEAADEIANLGAQLANERERMLCTACGTVTRNGICDCNRHGKDGEPQFVNYADTLLHEVQQLHEQLDKVKGNVST